MKIISRMGSKFTTACSIFVLSIIIVLIIHISYYGIPYDLSYTYLDSSFTQKVASRVKPTPIECSDMQPYLKSSSSNVLEVITQSSVFMERICELNLALDELRTEELQQLEESWFPPQTENLVTIFEANDSYFDSVNEYQVKTVLLPWSGSRLNWSSLTDYSNICRQRYFGWSASEPLCTWIRTPGVTNLRYDPQYNRTCNTDIEQALLSRSLDPVYLNAKPINRDDYWPNDGFWFPQDFYTKPPAEVTYAHIIHHAVINEYGEVWSKNLKIIPYGCIIDRLYNMPSNFDELPLYDELFVISHGYGSAVFHRMAEDLPRLSMYLGFLKKNVQILIHAKDTDERTRQFLTILGLDSNRLVTGPVRAKLVYLPKSGKCGFLGFNEGQILSRLFRTYITRNLNVAPRNKLLLIDRTGYRKFTERRRIKDMLRRVSKEFGLHYDVFSDRPVPSLHRTMAMFYSAVLVVAPHGAGLVNLLFSRPGTYVVEGVCNLPHVNMCFQRVAHVLNHHWHGVPSRGGCEEVVDVNPDDIEAVVRKHLTVYRSFKDAPV